MPWGLNFWDYHQPWSFFGDTEIHKYLSSFWSSPNFTTWYPCSKWLLSKFLCVARPNFAQGPLSLNLCFVGIVKITLGRDPSPATCFYLTTVVLFCFFTTTLTALLSRKRMIKRRCLIEIWEFRIVFPSANAISLSLPALTLAWRIQLSFW